MKTESRKKGWYIRIVCIIAAIVFAYFVPMMNNSYIMNVLIVGLCHFLVAMSVYVLLGLCGQNSFAQAGLWGIGAYAAANFTLKLGLSVGVSLIACIVLTACFCFLIGLALFRLKEYYFTFSSIGVMTILNSLFTNWTEVTGGTIGISNIPEISIFGLELKTDASYFYTYLIIAVIVYFAVKALGRTPLGRSFMAIRDNEIAANCMGVNSLITKCIAFAISGALCGLAGAMYSHYMGYICNSTFTYNQSTLYLIMVMLGGVSSPLGTAIGCFIMIMLQEWLRPLETYMMFIYGIGIIVLMVFQPEGLTGGVKGLYERIVAKQKRAGIAP